MKWMMKIRYHVWLCVALLLSFSNDGDAFLSPFYPQRQQHHSGFFRHLKMVPPLKDVATDLYQTEEFIEKVATEGEINENLNSGRIPPPVANDCQIKPPGGNV